MTRGTWTAALCGGFVGLIAMFCISIIAFFAVVSQGDLADLIFFEVWPLATLFLALPAALASAVLFGLLARFGVWTLGKLVGFAGGAVLGLLIGPVDAVVQTFDPLSIAILLGFELGLGFTGGYAGDQLEKYIRSKISRATAVTATGRDTASAARRASV